MHFSHEIHRKYSWAISVFYIARTVRKDLSAKHWFSLPTRWCFMNSLLTKLNAGTRCCGYPTCFGKKNVNHICATCLKMLEVHKVMLCKYDKALTFFFCFVHTALVSATNDILWISDCCSRQMYLAMSQAFSTVCNVHLEWMNVAHNIALKLNQIFQTQLDFQDLY